ncbi:hypothetical protein CFAM422_008698 [Trichoderma lentiforme]|uniref:Uncharacterized protein n=1 Tax=Trichoderma lentiforme TaxID=1567552 RepID=A0A9P5CBN0_9HYPO|nr:hypothetical protein CFAM422_008698 [Trichoderma lentiforme]
MMRVYPLPEGMPALGSAYPVVLRRNQKKSGNEGEVAQQISVTVGETINVYLRTRADLPQDSLGTFLDMLLNGWHGVYV